MDNTKKCKDGLENAIPQNEMSWFRAILLTPNSFFLYLFFIIAAVIGCYFVITKWSTTISTIQPSGIVQHDVKKWWGFWGGHTLIYEYNPAGGYWYKSIKGQRETDFSKPDPLPEYPQIIGQ